MYWDQLKSPDFSALDRDLPVVLPVTATEQHGDHLPVATDRMIADHFCLRLEKASQSTQLILPTVAIGCSEHHMDFAGSLTLKHETFARQCADMIQSAYRHGFRKFFILNSHGGNIGIGQVLNQSLGQKLKDAHVVFASWFTLVSDQLGPLQESGPGGVGHAGEFETSLMLLIAPHLVDMKATDQISMAQQPSWAQGDLLRGPKASYYRSFKQRSQNGVLGDPKRASASKGEQITSIVTKALAQLLLDLRTL